MHLLCATLINLALAMLLRPPFPFKFDPLELPLQKVAKQLNWSYIELSQILEKLKKCDCSVALFHKVIDSPLV
jgi:hypothetical protein